MKVQKFSLSLSQQSSYKSQWERPSCQQKLWNGNIFWLPHSFVVHVCVFLLVPWTIIHGTNRVLKPLNSLKTNFSVCDTHKIWVVVIRAPLPPLWGEENRERNCCIPAFQHHHQLAIFSDVWENVFSFITASNISKICMSYTHTKAAQQRIYSLFQVNFSFDPSTQPYPCESSTFVCVRKFSSHYRITPHVYKYIYIYRPRIHTTAK